MEAKEFVRIRHYLGKTQKQLAQLLCISPKAVQSFEEGWRDISMHAERQLLTLLSLKRVAEVSPRPCWETRNCPAEWRENCIVWEWKTRQFCWLINGTFCEGKFQDSWKKKIEICRQCEVFRSMIPSLI